MARYRKTVEIEAIEYGRDPIPKDIKEFIDDRSPYHQPMVWNGFHGSWIKFKIGDMLRIDQAPQNVYPIDKETFDQTYRDELPF